MICFHFVTSVDTFRSPYTEPSDVLSRYCFPNDFCCWIKSLQSFQLTIPNMFFKSFYLIRGLWDAYRNENIYAKKFKWIHNWIVSWWVELLNDINVWLYYRDHWYSINSSENKSFDSVNFVHFWFCASHDLLKENESNELDRKTSNWLGIRYWKIMSDGKLCTLNSLRCFNWWQLFCKYLLADHFKKM